MQREPACRSALLVQGLPVPVVERLEPRHQPDAAEVDLVRAREVRDVVRLLRAVDEIRDSFRPGDDRVADARSRWPCDHVAWTQLVRLGLGAPRGRHRRWPELERATAFEHDEGLGLLRMAMRDRAAAATVAADPVQPGLLGAGRLCEELVAVLVEG